MDSHTPQKRPLEEVSPNIPYSPCKRRASLGFEMASIPTITNQGNGSTKGTKLPKPFAAASSNFTQSSEVNDLQSRILSIQERLSRKPPVFTSTPFEYAPTTTQSSTGSNDLQETLFTLSQECREKHRKLEHLTEELSRLRRVYRNYQQKVEMTTSEIRNVQARLEDMEEEIINNVANEEKLIDIKLKENSIKLDVQFTEIEFEMTQEVQEVKNFDYTELVDEIEELKQTELKLKEEIKQQSVINDQKYNEEMEKLRQIFEKKKHELQQQEAKCNLGLEQLQGELDAITKEYEFRQSELETENHRVEKLKRQISVIEETMNNYVNIKKETEMELAKAKHILDEKKAQDKAEQEEFDGVYLEYSSLNDKVKKHDEHRRILENSIMEYQGKIRVYSIGNENEYGNIFNKLFNENTPASFIIDEFAHFTKSIVHGTNVGLISQYLSGSCIILQTMHNLLTTQTQATTWQLQFEYQAMAITKSIDLLTGSTFSHANLFESQKMRIDNDELDRVNCIINGLEVTNDVIVHVITVGGVKNSRTFESRLVVVDISKIETNEQSNVMQKLIHNDKSTYLDKVLKWVSTKSNPLVVSQINDAETFNILKTINSTNVACKKK
ncbi:hypothetical protein FOB58_003034 [Candida parapsilosis]|uniref:Spindle pole body-associated protein Vik1/Cik1 microtubule binding domain-containing protein n=2 Tax=Candida parapsilosis TaxID=5480 RepID=G8B766_CANPC|nr:uncharacterized protein CPAR2_103370 [Candida parapsilosis]KAF6048277.1 hypothetical protein FOB59_003319 [Candida parapsilosis]KAF6049757.1 hypothetical protein FOB58_003034 [Candida parapsilosis]KAF6057619.1 hypothetical protein FOB60_002174 [Candida parapsilosis]KAF6065673.1 hypothetical protein FOB61_001743 [Candida parapsilosis]KAI5904575.1 hypothetical protein K4G60_g3733 [Candida parapsilosis]